MPAYCYILTNKNKNVLYVGATRHLIQRMVQHKTKHFPNSFTAKYNCYHLMYYEEFEEYAQALEREQQLKAGNRKRKETLINNQNPEWKDLAGSFATLGESHFYIEEIW